MAKLEINHSNFEEEVTKSDIPVLVDFGADWCNPCKMMDPILDEIVGEYSGKIKVAKVDVDKNPEIAAKYGVRSIPSLFFFKDGEVVNQAIGFISKRDLKKKLEEFFV